MMPPISRRILSDDHVEAVLAYLSTIDAIERELPRPDAWLDDSWWEEEDRRRGPAPPAPPSWAAEAPDPVPSSGPAADLGSPTPPYGHALAEP